MLPILLATVLHRATTSLFLSSNILDGGSSEERGGGATTCLIHRGDELGRVQPLQHRAVSGLHV